jgi:hypothetical protein
MNRVASKVVSKAPYELWTKKKNLSKERLRLRLSRRSEIIQSKPATEIR